MSYHCCCCCLCVFRCWSCFRQFTFCLSSLLSLFLCLGLVSDSLHLVCRHCCLYFYALVLFQTVYILFVIIVVSVFMPWSCFKQFTSCLSLMLSSWGAPVRLTGRSNPVTDCCCGCLLRLTLSVVVCTVELNAAPSTTGQQARTGGQLGQSSETVPIKAPAPMWRCSRIMHMQRELHPTILASLEGCVDQVSALMVPPCPPPHPHPRHLSLFRLYSLLWFCALFVL